MKERIYSIPLTEALSENGECLLCTIHEKLDKRAAESMLDYGVMEPSVRLITNRLGFCRFHLDEMLSRKNSLALALLLETRMDEIVKILGTNAPRRLGAAGAALRVNAAFRKCALCEKVNAQMDQCIENLIYLLKHEPDFYDAFFASKGLCMPHFAAVQSAKSCGRRLRKALYEKQIEEIQRLRDEVHTFSLSFDYRNTEKALSPLKKAVGRLRGFLNIWLCRGQDYLRPRKAR